MVMPQDEATARSEMLLRDAEEDLQREKLHLLWQQWGSTIIGMALMLVVGTGAGVGYREWRAHQNEASTAKLLNLVDHPDQPVSAKGMKEEHAAIAWLLRAQTAKPEDLAKIYANASEAGDDTIWGWLARWNTLRLRMDDPSEDPKKLINDYQHLAHEKRESALVGLAWADAAVLAGERLRDPKTALDYLARAEKVTPRTTPMFASIADLKHLYEIRAKSSPEEKAQ